MRNKLLLLCMCVMVGVGANAMAQDSDTPKGQVLQKFNKFHRSARDVAGVDLTTSPQTVCQNFSATPDKEQACRNLLQREKDARLTAYRKSCNQLRELKIRKMIGTAYEDAPRRAEKAKAIGEQVQQQIFSAMITNCDDQAKTDLTIVDGGETARRMEQVLSYHMQKAFQARVELAMLP